MACIPMSEEPFFFDGCRKVVDCNLQKTDAPLSLKMYAFNDLGWRGQSVPSAANVAHSLDASRLERITKFSFGVINSHQARNVIRVEILRKVVGNMVRRTNFWQPNDTSNDNTCEDVSYEPNFSLHALAATPRILDQPICFGHSCNAQHSVNWAPSGLCRLYIHVLPSVVQHF